MINLALHETIAAFNPEEAYLPDEGHERQGGISYAAAMDVLEHYGIERVNERQRELGYQQVKYFAKKVLESKIGKYLQFFEEDCY